MELHTHGPRKYPRSALLGSSAQRGWRGIFAELRSHAPGCDTPAVTPSRVEITIPIAGSCHGRVTRRAGDMRQSAVAADGAIWLSPAGVGDSEIRIEAPLPRVLHLFLAPEPFARLALEHDLPGASDRHVHWAAGVRDDLVLQVGRTILDELTHESGAGAMLVETGAMMLAARLAQCHSTGGRARAEERRVRLDGARLRRTLDYIDAHLDDDLSVDALARECCLSAYHFTRMFSAAVGVPPHRYVARKRIEKAKRLLAEGELPLCEIAQVARFSNQASFTRAFTRATGLSPGRFRMTLD